MDFRFHLIVGTDKIMARLLEAIHEAKHSIHVQFFTFEGDSVGKQIAEALTEKARQGVTVEFLCDDFSNWKINDRWLFTGQRPRLFMQLLREWYQTQKMRLLLQFNGVSLKLTNPLNFFKIRASLSNRDHRKLVIIDEKIAFTGGFNLSEHNYSWHDTFTEIHDAPTVTALLTIFDQTFTKKQRATAPIGVGDTTIFHSTPSLMKYLRELASQARQKIFIESPYFSDRTLLEVMQQKKRNGLEMAVIIPKRNNTRYVSRLHKKYLKQYPEILHQRILPTTMLHAKHMLIDQYSVFGSSNFLSSRLIDNHLELSLVTSDSRYNQELTHYFTHSIKKQCE